MKHMILLYVCLSLTACGKIERLYTHWTGDLSYKCSRQGVEYVQSDSGLAVSLTKDGKPKECN